MLSPLQIPWIHWGWTPARTYGMWWRRQWHPTPVLLPGKSHGRRSLVGCSPLGLLRVGQDCATSLSLFTFMYWRRKWQPTPVFLPGESQGQVGCHLWGRRVGHDWSDLAAAAAWCVNYTSIKLLKEITVLDSELFPDKHCLLILK